MIVVDNALISYLIIPGEFTEVADHVRRADPEWVAPPLWLSEFRNVLRLYLVGEHIRLEQALEYVDVAEELMRGRVQAVSSVEVLALVSTSGCTAYDGEYVALARALGTPLVTTDREVLRAFPETALHPNVFGA